jgi:hypothetical protein
VGALMESETPNESMDAEKPKQPAVCPVCMGEGKLWCAMCGTWGNHRSGGCAPDANVEAVREKLRQRAEVGLRKYGVTTERTDMGLVDWLRHAQEEALDQAVYLEAAIKAASSPIDRTQRPAGGNAAQQD